MKKMKTLLTLSVVAVCMSGAVRAEADFRSVEHAVVAGQDNELKDQARKSIKQIVSAVDDFILLATKKIAERFDAADKKELQEGLIQLEVLIEKLKLALETGGQFSLTLQERQALKQWGDVLEGTIAIVLIDEAFVKEVFGELYTDVQKMVTQINKSL